MIKRRESQREPERDGERDGERGRKKVRDIKAEKERSNALTHRLGPTGCMAVRMNCNTIYYLRSSVPRKRMQLLCNYHILNTLDKAAWIVHMISQRR